jgi:hypothetical protein
MSAIDSRSATAGRGPTTYSIDLTGSAPLVVLPPHDKPFLRYTVICDGPSTRSGATLATRWRTPIRA